MNIDKLFFLIIAVYATSSGSGAQQLISPCPALFTYDTAEPHGDHWSGTITIISDADYSGLWMRTMFDKTLLELTTDFGEVVQREPSEYLIKRPGQKISTGETVQVRIFARFSSAELPPKLLGFRLNGRTVCPIQSDLWTSPCPDSFNYDVSLKETDKWFGTINLKSNRDLNGVWLRVVLDRPSVQLGVSSENWFGEVTTEDNKEYLIKNRQHKLKAGETTSVRFFVKYNAAENIPKLVSYRLNAETICPLGSPSSSSTSGLSDRTQSEGPEPPVFGSDFNPSSRPGFLPPNRDPLTGVNSRYPCGTVAAQPRPLITHGLETREGQWPWHAALYYPKSVEPQYICGASLITLSHVLTAAHCVAKRSSNAPVNYDDIEVYLGKYHLKNFTAREIQNKKVAQILIHPDYNHRFYANDVAVVKFVNAAEYTEYVRPVCLWAENTDLNEIVEKEGTVVGWGYDHTGKVTENLTKANMPVVSHPTCIWSYPDFFAKFANEKTFCAGFRNGTSVCNGDSGGGLVFPKKSSTPSQPIWQIRGIVSISVALQSEFVCDTSHYAIFTDSAKYLDWIKQNIIS